MQDMIPHRMPSTQPCLAYWEILTRYVVSAPYHEKPIQLLKQADSFSMVPQPCNQVEVLQVNGNQWIAISNIGCHASTINVYDSMHGNLSKKTSRLVADLLQSPLKVIEVRYIDTQWQSGASDCGLFALANVTAPCNGQDPSVINFDQSKMRQHFLQCIDTGLLTPFPIRNIRRKVQQPRIENIPIYCICRLIDDGSQMVQCTSCCEWFHVACVTVPQVHLDSLEVPWSCTKCQV